MKNIYIIGLLWACSTWTMAETVVNDKAAVTPQQIAKANAIRVTTRPEIMGLWGMEIPNNKKCVEYYNFRGASDVVIKSGQEWSYGLYDYQPSEDHKERLPALVLQIKYDNNEMDCSGQKQDQTGEVSQYFVKWANDSTIDFCASEKGDKCFATLRRVLP
ncbi:MULTISPECIES: hypothetical protein [Acinetobacter]|uniref:Uncharacterized protein n=1 Tax=Acinetobacter dispersus TaxID=70348 RepID=N9MQU7_9GAMM|nr:MULTISPECIES: hypothetical protein [Acinetobacter]ENW92329.1 hypothetical protein F904_02267 [Acinetobacter dispersus]ENX51507.1 hypothetical protein F901_02695 [Acinetobacter dispersus]MCH7378777.1 hypothetical protein [Acinetobacter higginsii]MCH7383395.1 hypothetical protein [Acinetobacter dispersus]MCH7389722.1 hypothetical protein [Acinetobacter dispersus]